MPCRYITGQAVGVAAALAIEKGADTRGISVRDLQSRLQAVGACLPNYG